MTKKIVGLTYVSDFEFPTEQGFTGSAGKQEVKGYMRGGRVKNTSKEFVQTSGKQATMDRGTFPPQSTTEADKEAGGRPKLKPKFSEGGRYKGRPDKVTGRKTRKARAPRREQQSPTDRREGGEDTGRESGGENTGRESGGENTARSRRSSSKRGMPKSVKGRGGLAGYAPGGTVRADPSILPGTGALQRGAVATLEHERQTRSVAGAAQAAAEAAMQNTPVAQETAPAEPVAPAPTKPKKAPGSERGKRQHYGLEFKKPVINAGAVEAAVGGPVTAARGGKRRARRK